MLHIGDLRKQKTVYQGAVTIGKRRSRAGVLQHERLQAQADFGGGG
jgi:hypothetical protein